MADIDNKKLLCLSCKSEDIALTCASSHAYCEECSSALIKTVLGDPTLLPPKCPVCTVEYDIKQWEEHLEPNDLEIFHQQMMACFAWKYAMEEGDIVAACPYCPHLTLFAPRPGNAVLIFCKNENCKKISCNICKVEVPKPLDVKDYQGRHDVWQDEHIKQHWICAELSEFYSAIQKDIDQGQMQFCPKCNRGGRKNPGECTHMTCGVCRTKWCYICGKSEQEVGGFAKHNLNWDRDGTRCPIFFNLVGEVDARWPREPQNGDKYSENDQLCLDYFHKTLILGRLARRRASNPVNFDRCWNHFLCLQNSGFTLEEIQQPIE